MSKRSRVGTASNLSAGDTDVINYVTHPQWQHSPAPVNGLSALRIGPGSGFRREKSGVFTLGSPERGDVGCVGGDRVEVFLGQCFYCKERIDRSMEVFMYSERAFCKIVCRQIQIIVDNMKERMVAVKRKVVD